MDTFKITFNNIVGEIIIYDSYNFVDVNLYAHYVFKTFDQNRNEAITFKVNLYYIKLCYNKNNIFPIFANIEYCRISFNGFLYFAMDRHKKSLSGLLDSTTLTRMVLLQEKK